MYTTCSTYTHTCGLSITSKLNPQLFNTLAIGATVSEGPMYIKLSQFM